MHFKSVYLGMIPSSESQFQVHANVDPDSNMWWFRWLVSSTHVGDMKWVASFWLLPGQVMVIGGTRSVNQQMRALSALQIIFLKSIPLFHIEKGYRPHRNFTFLKYSETWNNHTCPLKFQMVVFNVHKMKYRLIMHEGSDIFVLLID